MDTHLLVSCIMPTANRRRFVPRAIECFLAQDYAEKELVILDDGEESVEDLVPRLPRVRYVRGPRRQAVGTKRNAACQETRGEIIAHWDDDDWSAPWRLSYQVAELQRTGADVCGLDRVLFAEVKGERAWEYIYPRGGQPWVYGATLCYRKAFWRGNPFPDISVGEDARFVWNARGARVVPLENNDFFVGFVHEANTSPKQTRDARWQPRRIEDIQAVMADDWSSYRGIADLSIDPGNRSEQSAATRSTRGSTPEAAVSAQEPPCHHGTDACATPVVERSLSMMTVARRDDLLLPEFRAFNLDQRLPRMRQWELPFVLFQSKLTNTMSVLDCTINPVDFRERLGRLYPNVLYRYWNPVQQGQFQLPLGVPDESFDRVICVNTLEHLLCPQREALFRSMARKLKPGGRLLLTSDFYFDSFWRDPAFLAAGVMRADGEEVFNGFNKTTHDEWISLARRDGLAPLGETCEPPRHSDGTLYRQTDPFPHACIGAAFQKAGSGVEREPRRVLLALLTWNTRHVSVESVHALLAEGRMLRRLGQEPYLCVCDNGSTDGTQEALRALDEQIDIPHRFILNARNLGNSVARNQIIDYLFECGAHYVLFMDGDIEIVPFASFAMLRHMENQGRRLGCVGACSAGQTPYRERASSAFYSIERVETTNLVAWTQYGMFRRAVFEEGVRFDEEGPFTGPGWGFEDNDLAFQMEVKGFVNQRFFGMTYLHRSARSSITIMKRLGIDAHSLYAKRKQYVIEKWKDTSPINNGPLKLVRAVSMQL